MAALTMDQLEYAIPSYREYKRVWSPERLNNSWRTSRLESRMSRAQNPSK